VTLTELAQKTGQSRQNLSNKLNRNNFSDKELKEIATALDCTFEPLFKLNDTGEEI
jgi:transcriptional regulator with XRE-family HTH domain